MVTKQIRSILVRRSFCLAVAMAMIGLNAITAPADAANLYWGDNANDAVYRADLDGQNAVQLAASQPVPLLLAANDTQLYWLDAGNDELNRVPVAGGTITNLTTGVASSRGLALSDTHVYWSNHGGDKIEALALDGSDGGTPQVFYESATDIGPHGLAVHGDKLYWADNATATIECINLDGTGRQTLVQGQGLENPYGLAVTMDAIYWADAGTDKIQAADLDGANVRDVVTDLNGSVFDLATDGRSLYWADDSIYRLDLEAAGDPELIVEGDFYGLAAFPPIPEPATLALLVPAALAAGRRRRR